MKAKQLPMGWQEIPVGKFPVQYAVDEGTPEEEWDTTSNPCKERYCVRYWQRGDIYVRICKVMPSDKKSSEGDTFAVHVGRASKPEKDQRSWLNVETEASAEIHARVLMRKGGY